MSKKGGRVNKNINFFINLKIEKILFNNIIFLIDIS